MSSVQPTPIEESHAARAPTKATVAAFCSLLGTEAATVALGWFVVQSEAKLAQKLLSLVEIEARGRGRKWLRKPSSSRGRKVSHAHEQRVANLPVACVEGSLGASSSSNSQNKDKATLRATSLKMWKKKARITSHQPKQPNLASASDSDLAANCGQLEARAAYLAELGTLANLRRT